MKKGFIICMFLILSLICVSCVDEPGTATLKIRMDMEDQTRSIIPQGDGASLDVASYILTGTGPGNATFSVESDDNLFTIDGLVTGAWSLVGKGLNNENRELIRGNLDYTLTGNPETAEIVLDTLIGTGTMDLDVTWEPENIVDPELTMFIQGGTITEEQELTPDSVNTNLGTASVTKGLPSGSYIIRGQLTSAGTCIAGFVEAVRISNGVTTEGSVSLSYESYADSYGSLYVKDRNGIPVTGTFVNAEDEIPAKEKKEISFIPDAPFSESSGLKIKWYYDGALYKDAQVLLAQGNTVTIDPEAGSHRLDAIVYNDLLGSTGSLSYSFTAKLVGEYGEISRIAELGDNSNGLRLSTSSLITPILDDKFIVVTPDKGTLQICSMAENRLKVEKTYGSTDFDFIPNIYRIKGQKGTGTFVTAHTVGDHSAVTIFSVNNSNSLTQKNQVEDPAMDNINTVSQIDISKDGQGVVYADAGGNMYLCTGCPSNPEYSMAKHIADDGMNNLKYVDGNDDFTGIIVASPDSGWFKYTTFESLGEQEGLGFTEPTVFESINGVRFLTDKQFVILGDSSVVRYLYESEENLTEKQTISTGGQWADFYNDQILYVYTEDGKEISYYNLLTDGCLHQIGRETLKDSLVDAAVVSDYLIAVNATGNMEIFYVIQD